MAEYKIKDLENLTGIKSHTIRIWEKRYSILSPDRTDTKIRTYSDNELTHLLTVSMLNRNGIKISKIAKLEQEDMNKLLWDIKVNKEPEYSMDKLIMALVSLDEELFKGTMNGLIENQAMEGLWETDIPKTEKAKTSRRFNQKSTNTYKRSH